MRIPSGRASLLGLLIVLVASVVTAAAYRSKQNTEVRNDAARMPSARDLELADYVSNANRIPVRVFRVGDSGSSPNRRSLTGTVRARYETNIGFRVSGKISQRFVEVGETIEQGQVLFILDDEDYRLQQKAAEANLQIANANVVQTLADERRQRQLLTSNAISPSEYERSVAAKDAAAGQQASAQKQLELATNQLQYCRLKSDFSGVITAVTAEAGQVVAIGDQVCSAAKTDELEAVVDIPENRLPRELKVQASVRFWSQPDVEVDATLREVAPVADVLTRTYRSRFSLLSPAPCIKLGMTATVSWCDASQDTEGDAKSYMIPSSSIYQRLGKPAVWIVDAHSGRLTPMLVEIERFTSGGVLVKGPLAPGQCVVSAGAHKLDESQLVRIWEQQN